MKTIRRLQRTQTDHGPQKYGAVYFTPCTLCIEFCHACPKLPQGQSGESWPSGLLHSYFCLPGRGEYQLHPRLTVKSTGWENRSSNLLASYSLVGCSIHTNNRKQRPQTEVFILWFPPKILVISSRKHRGNLHLFCLSKINEPKWNSLTVLRCLQGFSGLLGDCALTLTDLFLLGPALRQSPSLCPPWKTVYLLIQPPLPWATDFIKAEIPQG